ncbi:hypothetical protein A2U01_0058653, partial [Trifolium medium]|nr:hypothetical protein [Trifolium medium]
MASGTCAPRRSTGVLRRSVSRQQASLLG